LRANVFSTIFQSGNLFAHLTASENVCVGLASGHRRRARTALRETNLEQLDDRLAGTLSGGEQQRVAVARAMARDSRVVLADEPTASLDDDNAASVLALLASAAAAGAIVIIASHDSRVASFVHRRLHLAQGRIS
jgi:putative ABC transport system ATP-binding protein